MIIGERTGGGQARPAQGGAPGTSGAQRALALGVVAAFHVLLLVALTSTGAIPPLLPAILPATLILERPTKPPPPLARLEPRLATPQSLAVPLPEIRLAAPPPVQPLAPRAIARATPSGHPGQPFRCRHR